MVVVTEDDEISGVSRAVGMHLVGVVCLDELLSILCERHVAALRRQLARRFGGETNLAMPRVLVLLQIYSVQVFQLHRVSLRCPLWACSAAVTRKPRCWAGLLGFAGIGPGCGDSCSGPPLPVDAFGNSRRVPGRHVRFGRAMVLADIRGKMARTPGIPGAPLFAKRKRRTLARFHRRLFSSAPQRERPLFRVQPFASAR